MSIVLYLKTKQIALWYVHVWVMISIFWLLSLGDYICSVFLHVQHDQLWQLCQFYMLDLPTTVFLYRQEMVLYLNNATSAVVCVYLGDDIV